jgi:plasmid stability protein
MAQLIVRGLDESVKHALRQRAAKHKRSMEAEARDIITRAVSPAGPSRLSRLRAAALTVGGIDDLELPERVETQREVSFD